MSYSYSRQSLVVVVTDTQAYYYIDIMLAYLHYLFIHSLIFFICAILMSSQNIHKVTTVKNRMEQNNRRNVIKVYKRLEWSILPCYRTTYVLVVHVVKLAGCVPTSDYCISLVTTLVVISMEELITCVVHV